MSASSSTATRQLGITDRDLATLRAIGAGRCRFGADHSSLAVDGVPCCDQFVATRLRAGGLITGTSRADLTDAGRAVLARG